MTRLDTTGTHGWTMDWPSHTSVWCGVCRELCEGGEKQTWAFSAEEVPMYIKAMDCEACAVSKRIVIQGECRFYHNEMFTTMFMSAEEAHRIYERATAFDVWLR
jgi:hypothetical protein